MSKHDVSLKIEQSPAMSVTSTPRAVEARPRRLRRLLLAAAGLAALAGAVTLADHYWTVGRFQVSTDDAYVQADSVTIAPKVSGYLSSVLVRDNQQVKAGEVLARIDDRDYRAALDQATATVASARARIAGRQAALDMQRSIILAALATLDVDRANRLYAEQDVSRYRILASTGSGTVQNAQQASARIAVTTATLAHDTATLSSAVKTVAQLQADLVDAQAALDTERARQRQAELNLSYTVIRASIVRIPGSCRPAFREILAHHSGLPSPMIPI